MQELGLSQHIQRLRVALIQNGGIIKELLNRFVSNCTRFQILSLEDAQTLHTEV